MERPSSTNFRERKESTIIQKVRISCLCVAVAVKLTHSLVAGTTTRSRPDADFIGAAIPSYPFTSVQLTRFVSSTGPLVSLDRAPWSDAELAKLRDFIDTKGSRRPGGIDKLQLALDSSRSTDCIKLELKGLKSSESVGILEGQRSVIPKRLSKSFPSDSRVS